MHKELYIIGQKLPKRDKLGIHASVENLCIEVLACAINGAFQSKQTKLGTLGSLRVKVETLKHLVRTECELGITDEKTYLRLAEQLVTISKETNGWISYTQKGA